MEKIIAEMEKRGKDLLQSRKQVIIVIDGSCTSGKTTLAAALAERFESNVFHMDDFFLRPEQRTEQRLAEPGGNVDYERFRSEVLVPLGAGIPFSYRPYDCSTGMLKAPVEVMAKPVAIIEGTYSHHPYLGDYADLRVFLKVSPEVREKRILQRPAFLHRRFFESWIPMEQQYFADCGIEEKADISVMPEENK